MVDILLFALVAVFFGYQLWRVLGRRPDMTRPPNVPPAPLSPPRNNPAPPQNNVFSLQRRPVVADAAPQDPLTAGLEAIKGADPTFQSEGFIDGARHAFEIIVKAYAEGDTATLRPLTSDEVYDAFAEGIRERLALQETVDARVVRLADPEIIEAQLAGRTAILSVKFVSSQISVTRDASNKIVEGDPERPVERVDVWVFSRNTRSSNPNWNLSATGAHE